MRPALPIILTILAHTTAEGADAFNRGLWSDATQSTIGSTAGWSHKVEIADIDNDGLVDLLFANGGDHHTKGAPETNQVFRNRGAGRPFQDVTSQVLGPTRHSTRAIRVADLNADGFPDIVTAGSYQTQSRLLLGVGDGRFSETTSSHLPPGNFSFGDLKLGDVDGDGDLDMVASDWGPGDASKNGGAVTRLWINDGHARFADVTAERMPSLRIPWSWDLEFVDIDNDYDLDLAISAKASPGSFLFENLGNGFYQDISRRLPQFSNNYEFESMDLNGDGYMDLVTLNDGVQVGCDSCNRNHVFRNDGRGGYVDATPDWWPDDQNPAQDDNQVVFLDFDSDGDADFLVGSLSGPDLLLVNHLTSSSRKLEVHREAFVGDDTPGTLGIAVADLNGDKRIDVVQSQGETAFPERVFLASKSLRPDRAPPIISHVDALLSDGQLTVRARIHDNKTPVMPHDWYQGNIEGRAVRVRALDKGKRVVTETPMQWYGELLWRAKLPHSENIKSLVITAQDAAGNRSTARLPISGQPTAMRD